MVNYVVQFRCHKSADSYQSLLMVMFIWSAVDIVGHTLFCITATLCCALLVVKTHRANFPKQAYCGK